MKRYKLTLPTPEFCKAQGLKFEGQEVRTRLNLLGYAQCASDLGHRFNVIFSNSTCFYIETDNATLINNLKHRLEAYGIMTELVKSDKISAFAKHMERLSIPVDNKE